jgi:hypothetical protein
VTYTDHTGLEPGIRFSDFMNQARHDVGVLGEHLLTAATLAPGAVGVLAGGYEFGKSSYESLSNGASSSGLPNPLLKGRLRGLSKLLKMRRFSPRIAYADARSIRFTQDSCKKTFKDGRSVFDLAMDLKSGRISPDDIPPIRIFEKWGQIHSLDNRRLLAFQIADVPIRVKAATNKEIQAWDITTLTHGLGITVRDTGFFLYNRRYYD